MQQEGRFDTEKQGTTPNGGPQIPSADEEKSIKTQSPLNNQTLQVQTLTTSNAPPETALSNPIQPEVLESPTETASKTLETSSTYSEERTWKGKRRAFSEPFNTVYPERWEKIETIGTNPVNMLSIYHKSRFGLEMQADEEDDEEMKEVEEDMNFIRRNLRQMYEAMILLPAISCFLCCRSTCKSNFESSELEFLQVPTQDAKSSSIYSKSQKLTLPEPEWRTGVHENLLDTVHSTLYTSNHLLKLLRIMNQFNVTIGFSNLYATGDPVTPEEKAKLKGRSMIGALLYMITFSIAQLEKTDERMHNSTMAYIRKLYLELVSEGVLLWSSTCHIVATAEIVLEDLERVMKKFVFRVRSATAKVVDLTARNDYNEQARLRLELRKEKRWRDDDTMRKKIHWPSGVRQPPMPNLQVVSRIDMTNLQWHPISLFNFPSQVRIIMNLLKRTKNAVADAFCLLSDFDQVLHTHRPNRKTSETETLFEDIIFLKDRFLELNTFPKNLLNDKEVADLYEVGRVLSDEMDELYISMFSAKDLARETVHVSQLCHEYLRSHERWQMSPYHLIAKGIQEEYHSSWDHFDGFPGIQQVYTIEDPIPLFHASVYPSLIRIFPVKVAKLCLSFQTQGELRARREPSSHSLWDAFDTIDNPAFFKHSDPDLNKHEKG